MNNNVTVSLLFSVILAFVFLSVLLISAAENPPIPEAQSEEVFYTKPFNLLEVSGENYQQGDEIPVQTNWLNVSLVYVVSTAASYTFLSLFSKAQGRFSS